MSGISTNKFLRELTKIIAELGMRVVDVERSKHLKITVECRGRTHKIIAPVSGSDQNGLKNARSFLRRLAVEMKSAA